jgi:hypothetical protein
MKIRSHWTSTIFFSFATLLFIYSILNFQNNLVHAQTTTPWFSVSAGNTTCKASIVAQTPSRISYNCTNPFGTSAGSYTSDPIHGANGTNVISLMMAGTTPPVGATSTFSINNVSCLIAFNESAAPVSGIVNFGTIPANTAVYQCTTFESSNQGSTTWP